MPKLVVGITSVLPKEQAVGKRLELYGRFEPKAHGTTTDFEGVEHRLALCCSYLQVHEELWIVVARAT
jgi:hypothetical protein